MMRSLPLFLCALIVTGACLRKPYVPKPGHRRPQPTIIESSPAPSADMDLPAASHPVGEGGREQWLERKAAMLEAELRESEEKLTEHRATIARLHRLYGDLNRAGLEMAFLRERNLTLETQLEVLESAHVERVAPLRRSD